MNASTSKKYKPHLIQSNLALDTIGFKVLCQTNKQTRKTCYFQKLEQSCEPRDFPLKEKNQKRYQRSTDLWKQVVPRQA
jgi:hypothetical protein